MKLSTVLKRSKSSFPRPGTKGVESEWLSICDLSVTHGTLWVGDPFVANAEDGCLTKAPNGTYALEGKVMDFAGRKAVSRLRAFLKHSKELKLGKRIGETVTDIGVLAVFDMKALDAAIAGQDESFQDEVMNHELEDCGIIDIHTGSGFQVPYAPSAFGDCDGTVYALMSGKTRVGFEVELLPPGYVYDEDS